MLKNYIKVAIRSLLKFKGYSAINLIGLSLGLTVGMMILIYVADELSFDQFHVNKDRVYRVNTVFATADEKGSSANDANGWPVGKVLEKEYPEVEAVVYIKNGSNFLVNHEGKRFREKNYFVSPEFLKIFSFPLVKGNPSTALNDPYTMVISEDMEKKYFPSGDALNKTLVLHDTLNFSITGVMKNISSNSHIQADMLISFATYQRFFTDFSFDTGWGNINMRNYILLKEGADIESFQTKAKNIYVDKVGEVFKNMGVSAYLTFEPLSKIYLYSQGGNGMGPQGSIDRIYLISAIAFFVILLACINFINLTTARSVYRSKEVGLRKVVGSSRQGLIFQFLSESFVLSAIALILAIAFIGILLPFFNQLLAKNYLLSSLTQPAIIMGGLALTSLVALLSGYYPALVISGMKPSEVLKGKMQTSARGIQLRRGLVIFQFIISIGLVTGTLVVLNQLDYMQKQNLGFEKDEVIVINAARVSSPNPDAFETFKGQLKTFATIDEVSYTNALPGVAGWQGQVAYPEGKGGEEAVSVEYMAVDENYINVLGLTLIAGRNFDKNHEAELKDGLILNEAAVTLFGWGSPAEAIGKKIDSPSGSPQGEVIGVVKDYHKAGLQQKIGAITMDYAPNNSYLYAIRYKAADTRQLISQLTTLWSTTFPGYDFNYFFLDESFEKQYQSEKYLANVFGLFAGITIIIALIGLLGLVSFMIAVRTKEIGIRKILGADVLSITKLISFEFIGLVFIAGLVSVPLIWYFANGWLEKFAYRITLSPLLFAATISFALVVTLLTISLQSIKAASANPINSLRTE